MVAIIFTAIGLLHLFFFKKFIAVTESFSRPDTTLAKNMFQTKSAFSLWNFLFYISIGLSIVFAVKLSGVIPVFSFLIIPAVGAIMIAKNNRNVIIFAALISILGAFFGLNISYKFDFPAGSSIVAALGGIFLIVSIYFIAKSFIKNKLN